MAEKLESRYMVHCVPSYHTNFQLFAVSLLQFLNNITNNSTSDGMLIVILLY